MTKLIQSSENNLSPNDLKAIVNIEDVFMSLLDSEGKIKYINDPFIELLNVAVDIAIGKKLHDFLPEMFSEYFDQIINNKASITFIDTIDFQGKIQTIRWSLFHLSNNSKDIFLVGHGNSISDLQLNKLIKSEEKTISHMIHQTMPYFIAHKGKLLEYNDQLGDIIGFDRDKNYVGFPIADYWGSAEERQILFNKLEKEKVIRNHRAKVININKDPLEVVINARYIYDKELKSNKLEVILTYNSLQMEFINSIFKNTAILEQKIYNRTKHLVKVNQILDYKNVELEKLNVALNELIDRLKSSEANLEAKINYNVQALILPALNKLKIEDNISFRALKLIENIEYNLGEICHTFGKNISINTRNLSTREIEIANYIKSGLSSKEIGKLLSISESTVVSHRNRIRKKLNINNTNNNLSTYLNTL